MSPCRLLPEAQDGRIPCTPRARLGEIEALPQVDDDWNPIPDRWVLPGCHVVSTEELYAIASRNHWPITLTP